MNTTKTLEERVREFCRETPRLKEESGMAFYERLTVFAQEVHLTALDACRDALPEKRELLSNHPSNTPNNAHTYGFNQCREETLEAITRLEEGIEV